MEVAAVLIWPLVFLVLLLGTALARGFLVQRAEGQAAELLRGHSDDSKRRSDDSERHSDDSNRRGWEEATPQPRRILLLGPAKAGKTTLMRQAVALWEERDEHEAALAEPYAPTRGLVMRTMALPPTRDRGTAHCQVCDAGGEPPYRRQWVSLVRDAEVCALVFVSDVSDESEDTRHLLAQLVRAPWARHASLLLALTHVDLDLASAHGAAAREEQYRDAAGETFFGSGVTASGQPLSCHALSCHDADAARRLLHAAAASVPADHAGASTLT